MTERDRFLAFALVGGLAAGVNIVARAAFSLLMPFEAAVVAAFPVALTTAFVLNRAYVFRGATGTIGKQYLRFLTVNLLALLQVWVVSVGLARFIFPAIGFTFYAETAAHIIGVLSPVVTSYYAHKRFSFRSTRS